MNNFKNIKILKGNKTYRLIETVNEDQSFKIQFEEIKGKIKVKFFKKFILKNLTLWEKIKILFNKEIEIESIFEFKNGEHVIDVSDTLYLLSKDIK